MPLGLEIKVDTQKGLALIKNFNYDLPDGSIMLKSGLIYVGTTLEEDKENNEESI